VKALLRLLQAESLPKLIAEALSEGRL